MQGLGWKLARILAFVMHYSGGLRLFERIDRGPRPEPRCTVIYYHRIASEPVGYRDVQVAPATFRAHIDHMRRRGYDFLSLEQYEAYLSGERHLARDSVVVTFDDGYRDNYTEAFPVLREAGVPAAVFLCVGPMEGGPMLWWDRIAGAVRTARSQHHLNSPEAEGVPADVQAQLARSRAGSDGQASAAISYIIDRAKRLGVEERARLLEALERESDSSSEGAPAMLTWDMVLEMELGGISFGAHSLTHPVFSQIGADEQSAELAGSKRIIEQRLGHAVTSFAYPYGKEGYFTDETTRLVTGVGFRWAYTTENGTNKIGADPLLLRRNGIRDVPVYMLAARLAGVFEHPVFAWPRRMFEGTQQLPGPADGMRMARGGADGRYNERLER